MPLIAKEEDALRIAVAEMFSAGWHSCGNAAQKQCLKTCCDQLDRIDFEAAERRTATLQFSALRINDEVAKAHRAVKGIASPERLESRSSYNLGWLQALLWLRKEAKYKMIK